MNVSNVSNINSMLTSSTNEAQRPPPPPPGATPPGLESAVSSLSSEDQDSVKSMLESMSSEQHDELKSILEQLKTDAASMSDEDIGSVFMAALQDITGTNTASSSDNIVDTYA